VGSHVAAADRVVALWPDLIVNCAACSSEARPQFAALGTASLAAIAPMPTSQDALARHLRPLKA
jgi:hypothetical protein